MNRASGVLLPVFSLPSKYGIGSPYQSFSTYAGNPYFIDLETLIKEGLLTKKECKEYDFGDKAEFKRVFTGSARRCIEMISKRNRNKLINIDMGFQ